MTIMNMSRSGQQKLSQFLFEYGSFMSGLRETPGTIRFNESDFEGCIVLTVEEAKIVLHGLTFGAYVTTDFVKEQQYLSVAEAIEKRIEHAVMSKQATNEG